MANHRHAVQCAQCLSPYGVQLSRLGVFEQAKSRLVRIRSERLELSDGIAEKQVCRALHSAFVCASKGLTGLAFRCVQKQLHDLAARRWALQKRCLLDPAIVPIVGSVN